MSSRIFLQIADITCFVTSADRSVELLIEGSAQSFLVAKTNADITVKAKWSDLSGIKYEGLKLFDSGAVWQLHQVDGIFLFSFSSQVFGPIPYKVALLKKDFSTGEILLHRPYFHPEQSIYPLGYPLDELLITNFLALGKGVEVHACGVMDSQGRGHLFVGQSTAGKTTMARLWENEPNNTVLSDDRIILRRSQDSIWMYGTPWHGDAMLASPTRAPITAVYFLRKGQKNELVTQKTSDSISRLFACSFPPFYNRDALDFTLVFLEDVVRKVPCYELKFTPDKSVVDFITSNENSHSL
jgi:hypothetical protein